MKSIDLLDKIIGQLRVLYFDSSSIKGKRKWICQCSCGNTKSVSTSSLRKQNPTLSCGCLKKTHFVDLTGQTFNKLTITQYLGKNKYKCHIYTCNCICGNQIIAEGNDVKSTRIKSCGRCTRISHNKKQDNSGLINTVYLQYKKAAKHRNISFNITKDFFLKTSQENCHYCGITPSRVRTYHRAHDTLQFTYNGLDRLNNDLGYEESNIVPSCFICNQAKHQLTKNSFLDWIKRVYKFQTEVWR